LQLKPAEADALIASRERPVWVSSGSRCRPNPRPV